MKTRGRLSVAGLGVLAVAWSGLQLILSHHAAIQEHHRELVDRARFLRLHPMGVAPVPPVHVRDWLIPAAASVVALVVCVLFVAAMARGGRQVWALLPALLPLSAVTGDFWDGALGQGWLQPAGQHLHGWFVAGAVTDAL